MSKRSRQSNLTEDVAHLVSLYGAEDVRRELEPQEGGGVAATDSATASVNQWKPGPLPSCDSELAAIKKRDALYTDDDCHADSIAGDRRTLLRMVDELTLANGIHCETQHHQAAHIDELQKERDDLRYGSAAAEAKCHALEAKLADAERAWRTWNENMSIEASKWEQRCGELEAKLAEAEKKLAYVLPKYNAQANAHNERMQRVLQRAELAESKLAGEEAVFATRRDDLLKYSQELDAAMKRAEAAEARCREEQKAHKEAFEEIQMVLRVTVGELKTADARVRELESEVKELWDRWPNHRE